MTPIINNFALPAVRGVNFLYANRFSRSLAVGWKEQYLLCSVDWLSRIGSFISLSTDNVETLCSKTFAKRFSYLEWGSYAFIPALYYLSTSLEDSEKPRLKKWVEFTFSHIPDILLVASIVLSLSAIYLGVYRVKNSIMLTFYTWSFLEQGLPFKPVDNQGFLFTCKNGGVVRRYDKLLGIVQEWTSYPMQFFYDGLVGKISALVSGYFTYMQPSKSYFLPEKIRVSLNSVKDMTVTVAKTPDTVAKDWPLVLLEYAITEKHFCSFEMTDQFPNSTLEKLEQDLIKKLAKDSSLQSDDKESLTTLIGKVNSHGHLFSHVRSSTDNSEHAESTLYLKNIFGALLQDWDKLKGSLLKHQGDFLCKVATGDTIKKLCLELYPEIQKTSPSIDESVLLANKTETEIGLILQQHRDLLFTQMLQQLFVSKKQSDQLETKKINDTCSFLFNTIIKKQTPLNLTWWHAIDDYMALRFKNTRNQITSLFLEQSAASRHQINFNKVIFGKDLGLSGYEDAVRDVEVMNAAGGFTKSLYTNGDFDIFSSFFTTTYKNLYSNSWLDALITSIVDLGDERIKFTDLRDYILMRAKEQWFSNTVVEHALEVPIPTTAIDDPTMYDDYRENAEKFLNIYLPVVLSDFAYVI